jgi:hypothetical protein
MAKKHRGGNAKLRNWATKAMAMVRKYGPGLARKHKLGSRGLAYASKSLPQYSKYIDPIQNLTKQAGYGMRYGRGTRSAGGALRSVGGRKCSKYCRRKKR